MLCRPEAHRAQMHIAPYWKIDNLQQCLIAPIEVAAGKSVQSLPLLRLRMLSRFAKSE